MFIDGLLDLVLFLLFHLILASFLSSWPLILLFCLSFSLVLPLLFSCSVFPSGLGLSLSFLLSFSPLSDDQIPLFFLAFYILSLSFSYVSFSFPFLHKNRFLISLFILYDHYSLIVRLFVHYDNDYLSFFVLLTIYAVLICTLLVYLDRLRLYIWL